MAGFSSWDDLISEAIANGKLYERMFYKTSTAPEAAGVWHTLWNAAGIPGAGAAPATTPGTQYDDTAGSMFFPDQASDQKHLVSLDVCANQNCTFMLYDRLVGVSGISVASTGNKTINSAALPRYSGAAAIGVECWLEVTTATTTTAPIVNLNSYTDQDGNTAQSGGNYTFPAAATNVDCLLGPMPLAAGDTGVRSVEVGLNVGTAASAGVINVLLIRPLLKVGLIANIGQSINLIFDAFNPSRLYNGASLAMAFLASGTTATSVWGTVRAAYG